jgi:hypothetical protein
MLLFFLFIIFLTLFIFAVKFLKIGSSDEWLNNEKSITGDISKKQYDICTEKQVANLSLFGEPLFSDSDILYLLFIDNEQYFTTKDIWNSASIGNKVKAKVIGYNIVEIERMGY